MAEISWAEGPRTALVCIDAWERGVPVGRLYTPRFPQGIDFYGLTHFLQEMEETLDTMELPTAFSGLRSFGAFHQSPPQLSPAGERMGKLATFSLRVLFRQNVSWQGSVTWLEGRQSQSFRSVLELVLMIRSALSCQESA